MSINSLLGRYYAKQLPSLIHCRRSHHCQVTVRQLVQLLLFVEKYLALLHTGMHIPFLKKERYIFIYNKQKMILTVNYVLNDLTVQKPLKIVKFIKVSFFSNSNKDGLPKIWAHQTHTLYSRNTFTSFINYKYD